jgi:hypothetical protein
VVNVHGDNNTLHLQMHVHFVTLLLEAIYMAIRTESLTIRIAPKTKYLAQLAAATHRPVAISLSSLIEKELLDAVHRTIITEFNVETSLLDMAEELWADEEADRMVKLAERLPFLLTEEQEWIWEKVQGNQKYWLKPLSKGLYNVSSVTFNFEALRADWDSLKAKAAKSVKGA